MQDAAHFLKALFTTIYQTLAQMFVQEFGIYFEPADRLIDSTNLMLSSS